MGFSSAGEVRSTDWKMFEPMFELINNLLRSALLPKGIVADFFFIVRSFHTKISEST